MKKEKSLNKILIIFLLISPFLDLLCGILLRHNYNVTIGTIIRSLFLIIVTLYTIIRYKDKKQLLYLILLFIYFVFFIIINKNINLNLTWFVKTFYFPIILLNLFIINKRNEIKIDNKYIIIYLLTYVLLLILGDLISNVDAYMVAKKGEVGWFNSANEISAILSISMPFLFNYCFKKIDFIKMIILLFLILSIILLGTKTPIIILGICFIIYFIKFLIKIYKKSVKKGCLITFITLFIFVIFIFIIIPRTYIYQNTIIHLKYLKIKNITELFSFKILDHFLFGQRFTFLYNTHIIFIKKNLLNVIFGIGYGLISKTIEMDLFDIFYHFGIIGFILFIVPSIIVLKNIKNNSFECKLSLVFIFLISFFTGHVINAPSVSYLCVLIILKNINKEKKNLLFISRDLNIGGIETSLIKLLDNIDYKKYNVDLILEKKEGILLNKVNKNINIIEYKLSNNKNIYIRKIINFIKRFFWTIFNYQQYQFSCCYATYSLLGNKLAKTASINSSIYIHGDYVEELKTKDKIHEFFDKRKLKKFKTIIFVSNESKEKLISYYKEIVDKSIVFNNFIDYEEIVNKSKEKIKEKKNKIQLLYVGRLDEKVKKVSRIIEICKKSKDINLWIVGNGPDYKIYEEIIKKAKLDNCLLLKEKSNPYPYIKKCDYLLISSDHEGFPVVYLEAIALNKRIITTIDVSDEFIKINNNFGYIVSKDHYAQDVLKIIKNDKLNYKKIDFSKVIKEKRNKLNQLIEGEENG